MNIEELRKRKTDLEKKLGALLRKKRLLLELEATETNSERASLTEKWKSLGFSEAFNGKTLKDVKQKEAGVETDLERVRREIAELKVTSETREEEEEVEKQNFLVKNAATVSAWVAVFAVAAGAIYAIGGMNNELTHQSESITAIKSDLSKDIKALEVEITEDMDQRFARFDTQLQGKFVELDKRFDDQLTYMLRESSETKKQVEDSAKATRTNLELVFNNRFDKMQAGIDSQHESIKNLSKQVAQITSFLLKQKRDNPDSTSVITPLQVARD